MPETSTVEMSSRLGRVPVLVGLERLLEAHPFLRRAAGPPIQAASGAQHAVHGCRTGGDDVLVDHHEGEPAVPVERMPLVEVEDRLLLVRGELVVSVEPAVVLVDLPVPLLPGVELAPLETEPRDEPSRRNLGSLGPIGGEVDDTVAHVGGNPARTIQGSPSVFFA